MVLAIKFGKTKSLKRRQREQNTKCIYIVNTHCEYKFSNKSDCFKAERECLQELECGVLSREEMPDGYTETTWPFNLDKIIEIYERNGGIKIENTN